MAVYGTVNDLAMSGARPFYLSAGFIIEKGLPVETLWNIVHSMQNAAEHNGVRIVTGDTKVVERGKGDGLFINTSGVGFIERNRSIGPDSVGSENSRDTQWRTTSPNILKPGSFPTSRPAHWR